MNLSKEFKTTKELVPQTLATLESLPTQPNKESSSPPKSPEPARKNPTRTQWQRKWLDLEVHHPSIQQMADEAQEWAFRWFRNIQTHSLLVLHGNSGCGKSHIASRIYGYARAAAFTAYEKGHWQEGPPLLCMLRWPETTSALVDQNIEQWCEDAIKAGMLILDDIGAENDPWKKATDRLCQILTRRERKFTFVTTNVAADQWPVRFDVRIADRLCRNSVIVDLSQCPSFALLP